MFVQVLKEGLEVKGIALGGGGHRIARVDVSIDGGKSYIPADLDDHGDLDVPLVFQGGKAQDQRISGCPYAVV